MTADQSSTEAAARAEALEAALYDLARDVEADLGTLGRFRGISNPSSEGYEFRDPGPNREAFELQKIEHPGRVEHTLNQYRSALAHARDAIGQLSAGDDRAALIDLHNRIAEIRTHDDAAGLVATFEEN
ncbi:hypothetical protein [Agromyces subbeticus]|uniref:hypothetical protein n=1 Tax=Agromyces subbeticus TaxID=293890 RepID=UPI0003B71129|nr:hypothetical protein [Agromyces subbeticus]